MEATGIVYSTLLGAAGGYAARFTTYLPPQLRAFLVPIPVFLNVGSLYIAHKNSSEAMRRYHVLPCTVADLPSKAVQAVYPIVFFALSFTSIAMGWKLGNAISPFIDETV